MHAHFAGGQPGSEPNRPVTQRERRRLAEDSGPDDERA
jgi:hypothetical protein